MAVHGVDQDNDHDDGFSLLNLRVTNLDFLPLRFSICFGSTPQVISADQNARKPINLVPEWISIVPSSQSSSSVGNGGFVLVIPSNHAAETSTNYFLRLRWNFIMITSLPSTPQRLTSGAYQLTGLLPPNKPNKASRYLCELYPPHRSFQSTPMRV